MADNHEEPKKPKSLQEFMESAMENRNRILKLQEEYNNDKTKSPDYNPEDYVLYTTHISYIHALPTEKLRYRAVALGDPQQVPMDIELYVASELDRIRRNVYEEDD